MEARNSTHTTIKRLKSFRRSCSGTVFTLQYTNVSGLYTSPADLTLLAQSFERYNVATIAGQDPKNPHIKFFNKQNPGWMKVCASIRRGEVVGLKQVGEKGRGREHYRGGSWGGWEREGEERGG